MKNLMMLLIAGTIQLMSYGQGSDSTRYLFGSDLHVSGAGGLLLQTGSIGMENGAVNSVGGGGGILFDRRLLLGLYGTGLTSEIQRSISVSDTSAQLARLDLGHGGLWLQYSFMPHKAIHPFLSLKVGWGSATWNFRRDEYINDNDAEKIPKNINDRVVVISPSAGAEVNIASWFRPTIYAGVRIVDGLSLPHLQDGDLDGVFIGIDLLFGGFATR